MRQVRRAFDIYLFNLLRFIGIIHSEINIRVSCLSAVLISGAFKTTTLTERTHTHTHFA